MTNPFVGPKPFGQDDTLYGRDAEVSELRYVVGAKRIVLLHAPSGAGKSSLLQAKNGLLAKLRASERFEVWGPARINSAPGALPVANRFAWSAITEFEKGRAEEARAPETLAAMTLAEYVKERSPSTSPLLVFDQFEEILRLDPADTRAKHAFFDQLGELLYDPAIWAIFVLREDYLAALQPYARQVPTYLQHRFRIDFLNRATQALDAVTRPLAPDRHFAPGVAEQMLTDLATVQSPSGPVVSDVVEPLQIQVVCTNLWETIKDTDVARPIVADDIGQVDDALAAYYDRGVHRDDVGLERQIRTFFDEQLTAGGTRSLVRSEPSATAGLANSEIDALVDAYLIRREPRAGADWLELSHDRLLEPVRASNERWFADSSHVQKFQRYATQWRRDDRPESLLLLGADLAKAQAWAAAHPELLSRAEPGETNELFRDGVDRAFLKASADRQQAIDKDRSRLRIAVAAAGCALIAAAAAGGFGVYASRQSTRAKAAELVATNKSSEVLRTLSQSAVALARQRVDEGSPREALAYLAQALRADPDSVAARSWMSDLLLNQGFRRPRAVFRHDDSVNAAAFSDDGTQVVTASHDKTVRIWNARSGLATGAVLTFDAPARDAFFVGRDVIAFSEDERSVWDPARREASSSERRAYAGHDKHAANVSAPSPTSVDLDNSPCEEVHARHADRVKDFSALGLPSGTPGCLATITRGSKAVGSIVSDLPIMTLAVSPQGHFIATGSSGGYAQVWWRWTVDSPAVEVSAPLPTGALITEMAFSPDERLIATASSDGFAQVWDVHTGMRVGVRLRHTAAINSVGFSPDGSRLVTASNDGTARVWDVATGQPVGAPLAHNDFVWTATFSPDGHSILTASLDGSAALWETPTYENEDGQVRSDGPVAFAVGPEGDLVTIKQYSITPSADSYWAVFNSAGIRVNRPDLPLSKVEGLGRKWNPLPEFSFDARFVVGIATGGLAQVFQVATGAPVGAPLQPASESVSPAIVAAFRPDGHRIVIALDNTARIWNLDTHQTIGGPLTHKDAILGVAFNADGSEIVTASADFTAQVWDAETGLKVGEPLRHSDGVVAAAFSPDGKRIVTGSLGDVGQVWDQRSGTRVGAPMKEESNVLKASFSPDGRRVLTVSERSVQIWDATTGRPLGQPVYHQSPERSFATIMAASAALLPQPSHHPRAAAFSADGRKVTSLADNDLPRVRTVLLDLPSPDDAVRLADLAEVLSDLHVLENGAVEHLDAAGRRERVERLVDAGEPTSVTPDVLLRRFLDTHGAKGFGPALETK